LFGTVLPGLLYIPAMRVEVNGVRLFFEVEGAKLVPDGPAMRERPTLLLLHGGPGLDHSAYKPLFAGFADVCQVVYLDHRGNGRSDAGPRECWTLAQWGEDVYEFCRALEIERPVVLGASFGGYVAVSYATRRPEHPAKLILVSTGAQGGRPYLEEQVRLFEQFGGPALGQLARRHLVSPTPESHVEWREKALPHYTRRAVRDPNEIARSVRSLDVLQHYTEGEALTFDMRPDLARIACPTLVIGGEDDPMTPIQLQADIAAGIRPDLVRFERITNAGHSPYRDEPAVLDLIREFILAP
jgi:proline iminopeptidase